MDISKRITMARHAMEGTDRGEEFTKGVKQGDIIVAGKNFGCGSSREQAAIAIKGAGVSLVIAESFARIFHRNCVNTALPTLELRRAKEIKQGDILEVNINTGIIKNLTQKKTYKAEPISRLESQIFKAGGLLKYLKSVK